LEQTLITIFDRYKFFLDFNFLIEETEVVIKEMEIVIKARPIENAFSRLAIADRRLKTVNRDRGSRGHNRQPGHRVSAIGHMQNFGVSHQPRDLDPRVL
jgi:hypothetical protein